MKIGFPELMNSLGAVDILVDWLESGQRGVEGGSEPVNLID